MIHLKIKEESYIIDNIHAKTSIFYFKYANFPRWCERLARSFVRLFGTATYMTNEIAQAIQFFLNLPFGETMAEQMT